MPKYYHVKKSDIQYMMKTINAAQIKTGLFYNVSVLPYRGKRYNPDEYATIKIG